MSRNKSFESVISSFYVVHFLGPYHRATVWSASRLDVWYEQATVTSPSWDTNYLCRYSEAFCKEIRFSTEKIDRCKRRGKEWFCNLRDRILLGRWKRVELPLSVIQSRTKSYKVVRKIRHPLTDISTTKWGSMRANPFSTAPMLQAWFSYTLFIICHVTCDSSTYQIDFLTSCQIIIYIVFICSEFHEIMRL